MKIKILLIIILLLGILGLEIYVNIFFTQIDYPIFQKLLINHYQKIYAYEKFPISFTYEKFIYLRFILLIPVVIQFFTLYYVIKNKSKIINSIDKIQISIKLELNNINQKSKNLTFYQKLSVVIIGVLIIITKLTTIDKYPFNGDEAWSYFSFINNGFLTTISFYPYFNNHVFYNLICIFFNNFISDPVWVMRLPNIIIYLAIIFLTLIYIIKNRSYTTAIIFLILAGFSFSTTIYAIHGRGYMVICFFTMASMISCYDLIKIKPKKYSLALLIIYSAIGGYTMPIFVYIFAGCGLFLTINYLIQHQYINLIKVVKYGAFTILFWAILYSPILLVSGINSIINNYYIQPYTDLKYYFTHIVPVASVEAIDYILGTFSKGYLIMLILIGFVSYTYFKSKDEFIKKTVIFTFVLLFSIFIMMILKRIFGEMRVFTMYSFIIYFTIAICLSYWIEKIENKIIANTIIATISIIYVVIIPLSFDTKMNTFYGNDYLKSYENINDDIASIMKINPKNIYARSQSHLLYLQLRNKTNKTHLKLFNVLPIQRINFDVIILNQLSEFPDHLRLIDYNSTKSKNNKLIFYKKII